MKQRICIFCEKWESGGIEAFLANVIACEEKPDVEIDLVCAQLCKSVFTLRMQAKGVRFVQLSGSQRRIFRNHALFRRLCRERKYDLFYLNAFQGLSLAYLKIARQEGIPIRIAHSHGTGLRKSLLRPVKMLLHRAGSRFWLGEATALWACSGAAAGFLFGEEIRRNRQYRFIPNGVDTRRFAFQQELRKKVRAQLGCGDACVIGHVGRLCDYKNQSFLLDVFALFLKQRPNSLLLLVGEGPLQQELTEKAKSLQIDRDVCFYGTTDQVEALLCAVDLFVFPSLFEGFGIAAVEAQASGLPVLTSVQVEELRITDQLRILDLQAGAQAWCEALMTMKEVPDRRLSAQKVYEAGFDVSQVSRLLWKTWRNDGNSEDLSDRAGLSG